MSKILEITEIVCDEVVFLIYKNFRTLHLVSRSKFWWIQTPGIL